MSNDSTASEPSHISDETLYQENAKVAAIFWKWRDKTMNRFRAGFGGVTTVFLWFYEHGYTVRRWHAIPLFIGAAYSFVSYLLDIRHTKIFVECYRIGSDLEVRSRHGAAIYTFIKDLHPTRGSLTQILHLLYLSCGFLFLLLSIVVLLRRPHP
jgi:hypothetical protein